MSQKQKTLREHRAKSDIQFILKTVVDTNFNINKAARYLGISRSNLIGILEKHGYTRENIVDAKDITVPAYIAKNYEYKDLAEYKDALFAVACITAPVPNIKSSVAERAIKKMAYHPVVQDIMHHRIQIKLKET